MADHATRMAGWLLAVVGFLIVYGSLYPFRFAALDLAGPLDLFSRLHWARTTRSDIAANVLLYLPFGACLAWLLARRLGGLLAVLVAALAGACLSLAIEAIQLYETRRVASLSDVAFNTAGALGGGLLAMSMAAAQQRLRGSALSGMLRNPVAAALVLSWLGYRLAPFAPALDLSEWAASIAALAEADWWAPGQTLLHLQAWLILLLAIEPVAGARRQLSATMMAMAVVLLGRVLFTGMALQPAEILGMGLALLLAAPAVKFGPVRIAAVLAAMLAATVAIQGLAPFDFRVAQDSFGLVPFGDSLTRYRATNLTDMFLKCFQYGALVWLLARSGLSVLAATLTGAGIVFTIELLQTWLPGQTADITDPLLAVAAGGLIAVFERGHHR